MRGEQQVEAALKSYEDVDSWKTVIFLYNAALNVFEKAFLFMPAL